MKREIFLEKMHYKYSGLNYKLLTKTEDIKKGSSVDIICPKHGIFTKKIENFIYGKSYSKCPKCSYEELSNRYKKSNKEFLKQINEKFGNSIELLSEYKNAKTKILIKNNLSGEIKKVYPDNLLRYSYGTNYYKKAKQQENSFVEKYKGNLKMVRFLYEKGKPNKVILFCPIHGEIEKKASSVLEGYDSCNFCSWNKKSKNIEKFIKESSESHYNKYDYSKVKYYNNRVKVEIICPIHGSFFQRPKQHTRGEGCPYCNESKGENKIQYFLKKKIINFSRQKKFKDCINPKTNNLLRFDFYLPDYNLLIEYDGEQHYIFSGYYTEENFYKIKIFDKIKDNYCKKNNINLLRISYKNFNNIHEIIENYISKFKI